MRYRTVGVVLVLLLFTSELTAQSSLAWETAGWAAKTAGEAVIAYYVEEQLKQYAAHRGTSGTPEGNYDEGLRYLRTGDETRAVEFLRKSADSEYSAAQCVLGDLAFKNLNYPAAREWYEKAAVNHRHSWAQFQLGNLAAYGYLSGGHPDYEGAVTWYRLAAKQRDSKAEYALGTLLLSGLAQSPSEAEKREAADLIEDAAQQGLPNAEAELSYLYGQGIGRPPNYCTAVQWAQKAAHKDVGAALYNLGVASHNGDCLSQDNLIAVSYYRRAIEARYPAAQGELNRTEAYLREELQRLLQTAAPPRNCLVSQSEAPIYDSYGNITARFPTSNLRTVTVIASEPNNDFVRISGNKFLPSKYVTCLGF